jgi:hypothetical protein
LAIKNSGVPPLQMDTVCARVCPLPPKRRRFPGPPEAYGRDRMFVCVRLESTPMRTRMRPVVRIAVTDPNDVGQEFLCWRIATAVADSLLGISAFNQHDVETSKHSVFLQISCDDAVDLPATAKTYIFGIVRPPRGTGFVGVGRAEPAHAWCISAPTRTRVSQDRAKQSGGRWRNRLFQLLLRRSESHENRPAGLNGRQYDRRLIRSGHGCAAS